MVLQDFAHPLPTDPEPITELVDRRSTHVAVDELLHLVVAELLRPTRFTSHGRLSNRSR